MQATVVWAALVGVLFGVAAATNTALLNPPSQESGIEQSHSWDRNKLSAVVHAQTVHSPQDSSGALDHRTTPAPTLHAKTCGCRLRVHNVRTRLRLPSTDAERIGYENRGTSCSKTSIPAGRQAGPTSTPQRLAP